MLQKWHFIINSYNISLGIFVIDSFLPPELPPQGPGIGQILKFGNIQIVLHDFVPGWSMNQMYNNDKIDKLLNSWLNP